MSVIEIDIAEFYPDAKKFCKVWKVGDIIVIKFFVVELDIYVRQVVLSPIREILEIETFRDVLVDVRTVEHMDSSGISVISQILLKTKKEKNGVTYLYTTGRKIKDMLKLIKMNDYFVYLDDEGIKKLNVAIPN